MGSCELRRAVIHSNTHLKHLSCRKSHKEKTSSIEESVYLTMVFLNKIMKGLWFSQCLSSDSETAGAVKH